MKVLCSVCAVCAVAVAVVASRAFCRLRFGLVWSLASVRASGLQKNSAAELAG